MTGIELIAKERQEQIEKHGYDAKWVEENPQYYADNQLSIIADMLIRGYHAPAHSVPSGWEEDYYRMVNKPYQERLIIAGALIAAELDRLHPISRHNNN